MMSDKFSESKRSAAKCQNLMSDNKSNGASINGNGQVGSQNQVAVSACNAYKQYGSKSKSNPVLVNLNMTVAKGTIYGLLGASGCGKSTLLSCIVGRKQLDSGRIWILGRESGKKDSRVCGRRVGYMPQELALYGQFSIKETMMYFGWIFGMKTDEIVERLQFLLEFLDLPSQDRFIRNLSSGQQRRVSFAVALLHDPELLILDEPTVGVDPLLREIIWSHLVHLSKVARKTVIITTHYIEEARQAHTIGLMRSGKFLAEESPETLMTMYRCNSLESVFLTLSRKQATSNGISELNIRSSSLAGLGFKSKLDAQSYVHQESGVVGLNFYQSKEVPPTDVGTSTISGLVPNVMETPFDNFSEVNHDQTNASASRRIGALLQKNYLRITRNVPTMLFCFVSPILQVVVFCLAIGREPSGLKLAIANMEVNGTECHFEPGCHFRRLSCRYLSHLKQSILQEYHSDPESAIEAVKTGQAYGAIYFNANFSIAMVGRMALGRSADVAILNQSEVQIWPDMSNQQIANLLNRELQVAYRLFSRGLLIDCNVNPKLGDIPIIFNEPIYGSSATTFTEFAAPGIIISIVFFLAVSLTSSTLIIERSEGLWDRSRVAGVSPSEILISHTITQFVVMCGQTALVLIFILIVFSVPCHGSLSVFIVLTLLQGINGMCYGFFISAICESEHSSIPLALGSFLPALLVSGAIWPLEGMPVILRYISSVLPLTQATTALRSILSKGWGLNEGEVYLGFVSSLSWIILFLMLTLVNLKFKRG